MSNDAYAPEGTYVVLFTSDDSVSVYDVFNAAHLEKHNFDIWAWKKRWEESKPGLRVVLSLHRFEIKPTKGHDGVERYYLPTEPLKKVSP